MAIVTAQEFARLLPPGGRVIGLDLGTKTIGVAVSDGALAMASPVETIKRRKFAADVDRLRGLMDERGAGGLVVGLPLNMDGSEGPRCQSVRAFADNLVRRFDVPLALWDERLSSAAVERALIDDVDMSRRRRREVVDAHAAAFILQGFLDRLRALSAADG